MTATPTTTPAAPAVPTAPAAPAAQPQGTDPIAQERAPETSKPADAKPEITPEIQALINAAFGKGREQATTSVEEKVAEVQAQLAAVETRAVNAIVARAAANAHDPAIVAKLVDLGELTSDDPAGIEAKVTEFLTTNPYLVKAETPSAPDLTPAPGVGVTGGGAKLLTAAEMDALTVQQLQDADTMKLYLASKAALEGRS